MKQYCAVAVWLLMLAGGAGAQTLTGSAAVSGITGYQTNPYLDPMLNEWESSYPPAFAAVVPEGGLVWSAERSSVGVHLLGRFDEHPGRALSSTMARASGYGRYELSPRWVVGGQGGWRRFAHVESSTGRWMLPFVRWRPSADIRLDLQAGWTGRTNRDSLGAGASYNSGFGMLDGRFWATDRLRLEAGVQVSDSRAAGGSMAYAGSGIKSGLTYWITDRITASVQTGLQYLQYEMNLSGSDDTDGPAEERDNIVTWEDLLLTGRTELRWQALQYLTVFARGRLMQANHSFASSGRVDGHLSAGATLRLNGRLARWTETNTRSSFWRATDEGMQLELTYAGDGQLFITGEFNDWADPGRPLRPIDEDRYVVELTLRPGRYQYSIRIVEDGETCWMELPDELRTVKDGFGSENGVIVRH